MRKKGFTLIELIVVMAIISILVLLGVPKYKEYTNQARQTKLTVETKELEKASQKYYMTYNDWPRLSNESYTSEKVKEFSNKIYNSVGKIVELEENGSYYDIDYTKLSNYISTPDRPENYILQNPVGSIYYLEGITDARKSKLPKEGENNTEPEEPIQFYGLSPEAFDKNSDTFSGSGTVTWDGELSNRVVTLDLKDSTSAFDTLTFNIYDSNNNKLSFLNLNNNTMINGISFGSAQRFQYDIVVPDGAVKFVITKGNVYDIYVWDKSENPKLNVSHTSNDSSITLNWVQNIDNYERAIIYRDGALLGVTTSASYIDKPLYSASSHTYNIITINTNGNTSSKINYIANTQTPEIVFRGLSPSAFDKDNTTASGSGTVTWDGELSNRRVILDLKDSTSASYSITFNIYDINNNKLSFLNLNNGTMINGISFGNSQRLQYEIVVPEGAVKFVITNGNAYDIYISDN